PSRFFRSFFELNGIDVDQMMEGIEDPHNEVVVPAINGKPLIVVRVECDLNGDPDFSKYDYGYNTWVLEGIETYRVLTPPLQAGSFDQLMEVRHKRVSGSAISLPVDEIEVAAEGDKWFSSPEKYDQYIRSTLRRFIDLIS